MSTMLTHTATLGPVDKAAKMPQLIKHIPQLFLL
jgi:hypothetical protein